MGFEWQMNLEYQRSDLIRKTLQILCPQPRQSRLFLVGLVDTTKIQDFQNKDLLKFLPKSKQIAEFCSNQKDNL